MSAAPDFPSMGATLFFGLTFVALITHGAPEVEYANPRDTLEERALIAGAGPAGLDTSVQTDVLATAPVAGTRLSVALPERQGQPSIDLPQVQRTSLQSPEIATEPGAFQSVPDAGQSTLDTSVHDPPTRATPPTRTDPQRPGTAPPRQIVSRIVRITGDRVFLREAPGLESAPVAQFDTGTLALMQEIRGQWRRVTVAGQTGWMFEDYLQPNAFD